MKSPFLTCLLPLWLMVCNSVAVASAPDQVARTIDDHLARAQQASNVVAAARTDHASFLRRLSLDLIGRIPTADEVVAFLDDPSHDKRQQAVDRMLQSPEHFTHFAHTWRRLLLPESDTDGQIRYFVPGFEAWLAEQREAGVGFDRVVHQLLAVPITGTAERPQIVLKDLKAANPVAFIAGKDASPAEIAAATTRLFLGVRLECAQCHDHPFDHWTQEQFWNQAAFFVGIQRKGRGAFAPILETFDRNEIQMHDTDTQVPALFLDHTEPTSPVASPRAALADWITARDNKLFSRAIANRVWSELMGRGIVDPVDDMHALNPPSHPELLEYLAETFRDSGFDLGLLYRSICRTEAYQRSSATDHSSQDDESLFARKLIKPMTGEQFFDSFAQAVGYETQRSRSGGNEDAMRRRVIEMFSNHGNERDPETSVLQALTLMNGQLVHQATAPGSSRVLASLLEDATMSDAAKIAHLYLRVLSRLPTDDEQSDLCDFVMRDSPSERLSRFGDLFWMLLNSAEFRWNH